MELDVKEVVPVIGDISVGKSSFLNFLIGKKILQSGSNLKTRFLLLIRHTKEKKPRLLHVEKTSSQGGKYGKGLYKIKKVLIDGTNLNENEEKIIKQIIKAIETLNSNLEGIQKNEEKHDYSKITYMLEINIKNICNNEFKETYDLTDIPGLNSISKMEKYNFKAQENEQNFDSFQDIRDIFIPLNGLIKTGFLIFDAYQYVDEYEVFQEIINKEKIKFQNFLIILNKIDLIELKERERIIEKFKTSLYSNFKDNLLSGNNTILGLSSKRLLEESLAMDNFSNFLKYYFVEYLLSGEQITIIRYLKSLLSKGYYHYHKGENGIKTYSNIALMLLPEEEISNELKEIVNESLRYISNYPKIGKTIEIELEDTDNEDCLDNIKLLNCLNLAFKKKNEYFYHEPSEFKKIIDSFFLSFNHNENLLENRIQPSLNSTGNLKLVKCVNEIRKFFNKNISPLGPDQINVKLIDKNIKKLEHLIKNCDKVRITIYGTYNAGKSTVINSFIGKELLETNGIGECTFRPILIKYYDDDIPRLYRAKMTTIEDNLCQNHEIFNTYGNPIAEGEIAIKNFIMAQNHLGNEGKLNDEETFILFTRIKILEEMNLPNEIKENIEFVDTAGMTKKKVKDFGPEYKSLINNTVIYIIVIDPTNGGEDNKRVLTELQLIINSVNGRMKDSSKGFNAYSIFIYNKSDTFDSNNSTQNEKNTNLLEQLIEEDNNQQLTKCNYSALNRLNVIKKEDSYTLEKFLDKMHNDFIKQIYINKADFITYLAKKIPNLIDSDFSVKYSGNIIDNTIRQNLKQLLLQKSFSTKEQITKKITEFENICKYLSFVHNNLDNFKISENNGYINLREKLSKKIKFGYNFLEKEYKKNIIDLNNYIYDFFQTGTLPEPMSSAVGGVPSNKDVDIKKLLDEIDEIFENYPLSVLFDQCQNDINKELQLPPEENCNYNEIFENKKKIISKRIEQLKTKDFHEYIITIQNELKEKLKCVESLNYNFDYNFNKLMDSKMGSFMEHYAEQGILGLGLAGCFVISLPYEIFSFLIKKDNKKTEDLSVVEYIKGTTDLVASGLSIGKNEPDKIDYFLSIMINAFLWNIHLWGYLGAKGRGIIGDYIKYKESNIGKIKYNEGIKNLEENVLEILDAIKAKIINIMDNYNKLMKEKISQRYNLIYNPVVISEQEKIKLETDLLNLISKIKEYLED